jgi:hypothetical protein
VTRQEWGRLWAALLAIPVGVWLALHCFGCRPADVPSDATAQACLQVGMREMVISRSCREALESLAELVRRYPECAPALAAHRVPDGLELGIVTLVCGPEMGDAGVDGG